MSMEPEIAPSQQPNMHGLHAPIMDGFTCMVMVRSTWCGKQLKDIERGDTTQEEEKGVKGEGSMVSGGCALQ
jgi:hypothetical protein